jgi:hypothetical protein
MTAPSGSELQFLWGFENADGQWDPSLLENTMAVKSVSGMMGQITYERVANMHRSRQMMKGKKSRVAFNLKIESEAPTVDELPRLFAHFMGKDPVITNLGVGAEQWVNQPYEAGDAANSRWLNSIFGEAHDGDGYPVLVSGIRVSEIGMKASAGKFSNLSISAFGCRDTFTSDGTADAGNAGTYTGMPIIRGHWDQTKIDTLEVTVSAAAAGGFDGTIEVTTGATAYGAVDTDIEFGKWYPLVMSSDGTRLGISATDELEICFPVATGTLAANDIYTFNYLRTAATPSYSTKDPLHSAGARFYVDGTEYDFSDFEIKLVNPRAPYFSRGLYASTVHPAGRVAATISLNRMRDDRDFLLKAIADGSFAAQIKFYGNNIVGAYDELCQLDFSNCQVTGVDRNTATENVLPEKIDIMAFRSGATDIFQSTVVCGVSAIVNP